MQLQTLKQILKPVFICRPRNFFFDHRSSNSQRSAAGQTRLRSDAASPALVYTLRYTTLNAVVELFRQPPSGRRGMRICFAVVFVPFFVFFRAPKLWDNRSRERLNGFSWNFHQTMGVGNVVWNVVPPLGECRAAAWRMANVDALRNLRYDFFAITRGRHRRLRYTTMSGRIDVI